ncbi:MAG: methyltransferase domain-containing protein [Caldilineaceae bacterium]
MYAHKVYLRWEPNCQNSCFYCIIAASNRACQNVQHQKRSSVVTKEQVRQGFGANAAAYATSRVHAKGASLARLIELVKPRADWQVLDVATAAGHTAFVFAPRVAHVVASDLTPEMLTVATKLAEEKGIKNVSFKEADAEALPFADQSFDLVTCRIAPHHFPQVNQFLAESARVLHPGGLLAVVDNVVPVGEAGVYVNDFEKLRDPSHYRCLSLDEWVAGFEAAGFTVLHQETAWKEMTFNDWAVRMGATAETVAQLRELLLHGPKDAADFLQPHQTDEDIIFYLEEAIVIGVLR